MVSKDLKECSIGFEGCHMVRNGKSRKHDHCWVSRFLESCVGIDQSRLRICGENLILNVAPIVPVASELRTFECAPLEAIEHGRNSSTSSRISKHDLLIIDSERFLLNNSPRFSDLQPSSLETLDRREKLQDGDKYDGMVRRHLRDCRCCWK